MPEHLILQDVPDDLREAIRLAWEQRRPRIQRQLGDLPRGYRHLRVYIHAHPDGYDARLALDLDGGTICAREPIHADYREAIDRAIERLEAEIQRHRDEFAESNECPPDAALSA